MTKIRTFINMKLIKIFIRLFYQFVLGWKDPDYTLNQNKYDRMYNKYKK